MTRKHFYQIIVLANFEEASKVNGDISVITFVIEFNPELAKKQEEKVASLKKNKQTKKNPRKIKIPRESPGRQN